MVSAVREANKIQNFIVGEFLKYVIFVVVDLKLISNHRVGLGKCHFFAPGKYPLHTQNMMQSFIVWILKIFSPFTERIQVSFTTKTIESGKENEENIWHSLPSKSFTYQPIKCFLSLAVVCIWGHNTTPGKSEIVCHFWMCKNMLYILVSAISENPTCNISVTKDFITNFILLPQPKLPKCSV